MADDTNRTGLFISLNTPEDKDRQLEQRLVEGVEAFFRSLNIGKVSQADIVNISPLMTQEELMRGIILLNRYLDTRADYVRYYFAKLMFINISTRKISSEAKDAIQQICASYEPKLMEELSEAKNRTN